MSHSTETRVALAVELFRTSPQFDDMEMFSALLARGISRRLAARLIEFVPMAYCQVVLGKLGIRFSESFRRGGTQSRSRPLSSEPVWRAACSLAASEASQGIGQQEMLLVAGRSAEFQAVNNLLKQGSKAAEITLTVPVLLWPEDGSAKS